MAVGDTTMVDDGGELAAGRASLVVRGGFVVLKWSS